MDAPEAATEEASPPPPRSDAFAAASGALEQAVRVAEAALTLLRAELRLARGSALALVWLAFALIFLGVGAWLATSAAIAAGVYELTGNLFVGIGSVALANVIGIVLALFAMRSCWRDLTLPCTRRMLGQLTDGRHESP